MHKISIFYFSTSSISHHHKYQNSIIIQQVCFKAKLQFIFLLFLSVINSSVTCGLCG